MRNFLLRIAAKAMSRHAHEQRTAPKLALNPKPEYRRRRLEHMSPERASRAFAAVACITDPIRAAKHDDALRARRDRIMGRV